MDFSGQAQLYSKEVKQIRIKQANTLTEDEDRSTGYIRVPPYSYRLQYIAIYCANEPSLST